MGKNKRIVVLITFIIVMSMVLSSNVFAAGQYANQQVAGIQTKYVQLSLDNQNIVPVMLRAGSQMNATEALSTMAKNQGAFAAINGTYFEAYNGTPVPWGTMIENGKVLHISQSGAVFGITSDGDFLVDRLTFEFQGYINGEYRAIPWRINHPSTESEAITIFTPEYGALVSVSAGAKGVVISDGVVNQIALSSFYVPEDGFAIVYNKDVAYLVDERYELGDTVSYDVAIHTTFTNPEDWNDVVVGLGAGPSLIIDGMVTAQGEAEGFTEAKINSGSTARSFIGATSDGTIVIGNLSGATVKQAADVCKNLGLVNAMCLDGGGSSSLYYPSANVNIAGRNINNGLAFIDYSSVSYPASPTTSKVLVDGKEIPFQAYNIGGNNYFKLRDIAMAMAESEIAFSVEWDNEQQAILLQEGESYQIVGGELALANSSGSKNAKRSNAKVYLNNEALSLQAYNIDGNTYFKLRDLGTSLNFLVDWDQDEKAILINTN